MGIISWIISKILLVGLFIFSALLLISMWRSIKYYDPNKPFFERMTEEEMEKWKKKKEKSEKNLF